MGTSDINHERECKLDAASDDDLLAVRDYVLKDTERFTPVIDRVREGIPKDMLPTFAAPLEVTEPRIRLYFDDKELSAYAQGIEIRQEPRPSGGVKQMVKLGGNADSDNPVLDRMEYSTNLDHFGMNLDAIKPAEVRELVKSALENKTLKPIVCMVSQRTRLKYHPNADPLTTIELGFDTPCRGHTIGGYTWNAPQLELELIEGSETALHEESAFFIKTFGLKPNVTSKPYKGFKHLKTHLKTLEGKIAFKHHPENYIWWT